MPAVYAEFLRWLGRVRKRFYDARPLLQDGSVIAGALSLAGVPGVMIKLFRKQKSFSENVLAEYKPNEHC